MADVNAVADISSVEYLNFFKNEGMIYNCVALVAFIGGRHLISDLYDNRKDLFCNPLVKILILFSVILVNIKNVKATIIIFFLYIFVIDDYIHTKCDNRY